MGGPLLLFAVCSLTISLTLPLLAAAEPARIQIFQCIVFVPPVTCLLLPSCPFHWQFYYDCSYCERLGYLLQVTGQGWPERLGWRLWSPAGHPSKYSQMSLNSSISWPEWPIWFCSVAWSLSTGWLAGLVAFNASMRQCKRLPGASLTSLAQVFLIRICFSTRQCSFALVMGWRKISQTLGALEPKKSYYHSEPSPMRPNELWICLHMEPPGLRPWRSTALVVGALEEKEEDISIASDKSTLQAEGLQPRSRRAQLAVSQIHTNFCSFLGFLFFQCVRHHRFSKKDWVPLRVKDKRMCHGFPKTFVTSFVKLSFLERCLVGKYFFDCKVLTMSLI